MQASIRIVVCVWCDSLCQVVMLALGGRILRLVGHSFAHAGRYEIGAGASML